MSDQIRLSKHRALYTGSNTKDPYLRQRALNDRVSLAMMRTHPTVYHAPNVQSSNPRNYSFIVPRHQAPLHIVPQQTGATRYIRGSSRYNREIQTRIAELAKMA
jgi:hypothetical protein